MYQESDLNIIKDVILSEIEPYQIVLFGSYAKGTQDENSDVDIIILTKEGFSRQKKLDLIYRLQRKFLYLNYRIDLILKKWDDFNEYKDYIGTINYDVSKEGKVLWMR
ncbi:MAG: nucleotidyltransferase domain-containing protein [Candidatus Cloacimonetes bacterium]|nr:nucleotidyltransferase domain-containing protein [Candidatus Cloacimonadota bacterium]